MANTGSTKRPFEFCFGDKPKFIGSLSEFGRIKYVNKKVNIKKSINRRWCYN